MFIVSFGLYGETSYSDENRVQIKYLIALLIEITNLWKWASGF